MVGSRKTTAPKLTARARDIVLKMAEWIEQFTQADREAAASYWKVSRIGNSETQRRYLSGEADNSFIVQAFAAHRIAAERETVERIVEWMRESAAWHEKHDDGLSGFGHISLGQTEAADAIEEGDWRND